MQSMSCLKSLLLANDHIHSPVFFSFKGKTAFSPKSKSRELIFRCGEGFNK